MEGRFHVENGRQIFDERKLNCYLVQNWHGQNIWWLDHIIGALKKRAHVQCYIVKIECVSSKNWRPVILNPLRVCCPSPRVPLIRNPKFIAGRLRTEEFFLVLVYHGKLPSIEPRWHVMHLGRWINFWLSVKKFNHFVMRFKPIGLNNNVKHFSIGAIFPFKHFSVLGFFDSNLPLILNWVLGPIPQISLLSLNSNLTILGVPFWIGETD